MPKPGNNHSNGHSVRLTARESADRLAEQTSPVAGALSNLLLAVSRSRTKDGVRGLPIFEVRYPYGADISGARSDTDKFSKILPPCTTRPACDSCKQLLAEIPNHRPLIFVIDGSCEEYIQYLQFAPTENRRAPVRFYSKGEVIGLNRLLNQFYLPIKPIRPIFGYSARRISSGSLTVFFSASLSNPRLIEHLREGKLSAPLLKSLFGDRHHTKDPKELGKSLDTNHSLFFKTMADAAMRRKQSSGWQCRLLLVPIEPLAKLLKQWEGKPEVHAFLVAALSDFFVAVRNTRTDSLRQMTIFNRLAAKAMSPYVKNTVHYLIELIRGEFPGFVPHNPVWGDDFGPAREVYQYMDEIGVPRFLKEFPGLLRPAHLNPAASEAIYYSLERPTLLAPIGKERSVRSVAKKLYAGLERICATNEVPSLFDSMDCEFFVSAGKSRGRQNKKESDASDNLYFKSYQDDSRIRQDFACQLDRTQNNGWSALCGRNFHRGRGVFMASFVRIRTAAKIEEERSRAT